jgi:hypothetical protein
MPIHLDDLEFVCEVAGISSALIVPCNMCPAVTVAVREEQTLSSIIQESRDICSFRTIHQETAIPIKRKGCKHKSVQEHTLSPLVHVHVDFRST